MQWLVNRDEKKCHSRLDRESPFSLSKKGGARLLRLCSAQAPAGMTSKKITN